MKGEETRNRLLQAGIEAVQRKSYHGTGIKEILDTVGVPKGSFYYYFKSKEDFGIQMIRKFTASHVEWIKTFFQDQSLPPLIRLRRYFETCREYYRTNGFCQGCLVSSMSAEAGEMSPAIQTELRQGLTDFQNAYQEFLLLAEKQGDLPPKTDTEALAGFILNSWEGAVLRMQITKNLTPLDHFLVYLFDHVLP